MFAVYSAAGILLALTASAHAATEASLASADRDYFTIGSVRARNLTTGQDLEIRKAAPVARGPHANAQTATLGSVMGSLGSMASSGSSFGPMAFINVGKAIWDVIVKNKPVVNVQTDWASALPAGVKDANDLSDWSQAKVIQYEIAYRNVIGIEVASLTYQVSYQSGGRYHGTGQYLTNVTVIPTAVNVVWGYTLNASSKVMSITNLGSESQPEADVNLLFNWVLSTPIRSDQSTIHFEIRGNGEMRDLNAPMP